VTHEAGKHAISEGRGCLSSIAEILDDMRNGRMVILVDRGSASASEILAGALQHYGIATMVGDRTFGKGSVQELVEITDDTSLKLTVARWVGPGGEPIPLEGLVPDVQVNMTEEDREAGRDPQMEKAVEVVSSQ